MRSLAFGFAASFHRFRFFLLTAAAATAFFVTPASAADTDGDGIPDEWERSGHGPLNPAVHDVRVGRQDIVLVVARRPGSAWSTVSSQLDRLRAFYRSIPTRNPDGSTGINVVVVQGPELPASDATTDYGATYPRGFPAGWRGIGHGYLLENTAGGGGQTISPEWSASGYDWRLVAHELGHQLQLEHAPPDSGISPLYTSIMSYAYSYTFGGDPNAVRFSDGGFLAHELNERSLNETLPFPIDRVRFLEHEFGFRLRASGTSTQVDWDRDGVFGETNVRADINDGSSVGTVTPSLDGGLASGAPSLTQVGPNLYMVYNTMADPGARSRPGGVMMMQMFNGGAAFTAPRRLVVRRLTGDPTAVAFGNRLAIAYVSGQPNRPGLPFVTMYNTSATGLGEGGAEALDWDQMVDQAVIAAGRWPATQLGPVAVTNPVPGVTPQTTRLSLPARDRAWMFTWTRASRAIRAIEVTDTAAAGAARPVPTIARGTSHEIMNGATALHSDHEIGVAYDTLTNKIIMVTYETNWGHPNRIRVNTLRMNSAGRWEYESHRWVGAEASGAWGNNTPVIVLNPTQPIDGHSQMSIYIRGGNDPDVPEVGYNLREIADRTQHDGWRIKQMIDVWNQTVSPPGAALYNGAYTYALRWTHLDPRVPNGIIFYRQTGVVEGPLRDMNEVEFLRNTGLRRALERMREYHGVAAP